MHRISARIVVLLWCPGASLVLEKEGCELHSFLVVILKVLVDDWIKKKSKNHEH